MNLLPCPHCGKTTSVRIASSMENEDDIDHGHPESWTVACDASTDNRLGGCGAAAGYRFTKAEAVELWNRRATPPEEVRKMGDSPCWPQKHDANCEQIEVDIGVGNMLSPCGCEVRWYQQALRATLSPQRETKA